MKVPLAGIICGYLRVFWASFSGAERGGPGYCRGGARLRRAGCEGGLNLEGFSRTRCLLDDAALLEFEAWRMRGRLRSDEG